MQCDHHTAIWPSITKHSSHYNPVIAMQCDDNNAMRASHYNAIITLQYGHRWSDRTTLINYVFGHHNTMQSSRYNVAIAMQGIITWQCGHCNAVGHHITMWPSNNIVSISLQCGHQVWSSH